MRIYLLHIIIFFCTIQGFHSQEEDGVVSLVIPVRNSLKFNRYIINPTFSFVREQNRYISFNNKRQWTQFDDSPQTYLFGYSGRFNEDIGVGIGLFQQNYGVLTTFGGILNFAYNVGLDRYSNLTFGMNIGVYRSGLNQGKVVTNFPDPSLENIPSNMLLTVNPGINYGTEFIDFGLSVNNAVAYNVKTSEILEDDPEQSIQAHAMYTGYFNTRGFFDESKFTGLVRSEFKKEKTILSGIAMINIPKGIWAQAGYNTLYGLFGGLGLNISSQIAIEYNYEKAMGDLSGFGNSHDITLAYRFKNQNRYRYSGDDEESSLIIPDKKSRRPSVRRRTASGPKVTAKQREEARAKAKAAAEARVKAAEERAKQRAEAAATAKARAEEAQRIAQEEARAKAAAEAAAKAKAEEDARKRAEAAGELETQRIAQEEARAKAAAEAAAKAKAEEDARKRAEAAAELEGQRIAQEEARAKAAAEAAAKAKAEEEARKQAEAAAELEAQRIAQEEARVKAAAEAAAKAKAEEEARKQAEAAAELEAQRIAQEEARVKAAAEAAAKAKAEEEARKQAEAAAELEAQRIAQEEARVKAAAEAAAKAKAEEEARKQAEAAAELEAQRIAQEEARVKAAAEAAAKAKAEEEARKQAEAAAELEAQRIAQEEARVKAAAEAAAKAKAEEEARKQAEAAAELEAQRIAQEEARVKAAAEAAAIAKAEQEEARRKAEALAALPEPVANSTKSMNDLLTRLENTVASRDQDLKDLKEENDLGEKGIFKAPKPFKSITAENAKLEALKLELDNVINTRQTQIAELERINKGSLDPLKLKMIERLKGEQVQALSSRKDLMASLEKIKIATEIERKRRIKRAAYDNADDRYSKDMATLERIKRNTPVSSTPLQEGDFDFGEEQTGNIRIVKDVKNAENGYYLVVAVHGDVDKRDEFVKQAVSAGQSNINFFYDENTSKYFIYYDKFSSVEQATRALQSKGDKPYNSKMSMVKIEN